MPPPHTIDWLLILSLPLPLTTTLVEAGITSGLWIKLLVTESIPRIGTTGIVSLGPSSIMDRLFDMIFIKCNSTSSCVIDSMRTGSMNEDKFSRISVK